MQDNEIIKALECCTIKHDCENCPLEDTPMQNIYDCCLHKIRVASLDLINRQQAEIERWTKELKITREYIHYHNLEWDLLSYYTRKEEQNA